MGAGGLPGRAELLYCGERGYDLRDRKKVRNNHCFNKADERLQRKDPSETGSGHQCGAIGEYLFLQAFFTLFKHLIKASLIPSYCVSLPKLFVRCASLITSLA